MERFLSFTTKQQLDLCTEAEVQLGLPAVTIEKDLWVCWTLRLLFSLPDWGCHLTFKGGTSLSKAWKLIDRFSEDVDVVIDRGFLGFGGQSLGSRQRKRLREQCAEHIQSDLLPSLQHKFCEALPGQDGWSLRPATKAEDPDQQTLMFEYPSVLPGQPTYIHRVVKIELGARSDIEPNESPMICPYLADAFPDLIAPSSFSLRTVAARRTFWEKAMLLHEEICRPPEKSRNPRLARHYYDLWCLITKGIAEQAVSEPGLFERVAQHRQLFFRQSWMTDYSTLRKGSLQIVPPPDQEAGWRRDYEAMRKEMFIGDPPAFGNVLGVVREFQDAFNRP